MVAPVSATGRLCGAAGMICAPTVGVMSTSAPRRAAAAEADWMLRNVIPFLPSALLEDELDETRSVARCLGALRAVVFEGVVLAAFDARLPRACLRGERVLAPDDEVGILVHIERADARVDAEDLGGVDRHERERLLLGETGAQRLRRFPVHPAGDLAVVGMQRRQDTGIAKDARIEGGVVERLHLERAPVAPDDRGGAMSRQLRRDLERLHRMMERLDLEFELLGEAHQHQDLILKVAVRPHENVYVQDVDERPQSQLAMWRNEA